MLRKIRDLSPAQWGQPAPCSSPDHEFPSMIVLEPGVWEHVCAGCGRRTQVVIPLVTCRTDSISSARPGTSTDAQSPVTLT
jgi:hypothetical protein